MMTMEAPTMSAPVTDLATPSERRVLLVGDVHGDPNWFTHVCFEAQKNDCSVILQLGDFGFWEHTVKGLRFLNRCSDVLTKLGIEAYWLGGNHENYALLNEYKPRSDGFVPIRRNLLYIPRGHRWEWAGTTFLALGGAYSVDKNWRVEGVSWWPEETITEADVIRSISGGPVEILVSHDAPWGAEGVIGTETAGDKDQWAESEANRRRLRAVVDMVQPKVVFHGHYHHRNTTRIGPIRIEGLGRDGQGQRAVMVLDLPFRD